MNKFLNMKVIEAGAWMDGGTFTLKVSLKNGQLLMLEFVQSMMLEIRPEGKYSGQLYLDDVHVTPRSELEKEIIEGLKIVLYDKGGMPWMDKVVLAEKIEYLESGKYLSDLKQLQDKNKENGS
ncbi:MAG: hypothetical protein AB8B72_01455 [Crocinitomicaceae bacterium]